MDCRDQSFRNRIAERRMVQCLGVSRWRAVRVILGRWKEAHGPELGFKGQQDL